MTLKYCNRCHRDKPADEFRNLTPAQRGKPPVKACADCCTRILSRRKTAAAERDSFGQATRAQNRQAQSVKTWQPSKPHVNSRR